MRRGEVWWVERPGAERRPHLVLTRDAAIERMHTVLGVPTTTTIRAIPTEVEIGPEHGMPTTCVLSLDNTRVLPKSFFRERICQLGAEPMDRVCRALAIATGCR